MQDAMFKIIIFGDGGVGKTTLVNRYMTGVFKGDSGITIGVDFHIKKLEVLGKQISLQIWDFAGESRFRFLLPSYAIGSSGGLFMYDITRFSSLRNFEDWLNIFKKGYMGKDTPLPIIMIGGKLDLDFKRAVSQQQALDLAQKHNLYSYVECSAKSGENVEDIFIDIARLMMDRAGLL